MTLHDNSADILRQAPYPRLSNGVWRDECLDCWPFASMQETRRINHSEWEEYNNERLYTSSSRSRHGTEALKCP
jgi:hypothetical protein